MAAPSRSVDRALQLLVLVAQQPGVLRFADLQRMTAFPKASLHALLTSLTDAGFLQVTPTASFAIGIKAFEVGTSVTFLPSAKAASDPVLERLRTATQESCNFGTLEGGDVLYLNGRDAHHELRMVVRIGGRKSAHGTGLGKAMLARLTDEQVFGLYHDEQLPTMTDKTIRTLSVLLEDLRACRSRGYALESEESTPGVGCIGMATRAADGRIYGVSVAAPVQRVGIERLEEFRPLLAESLAEIEAVMRVSSWFGPGPKPVGAAETN